jgi:hypothetical protein
MAAGRKVQERSSHATGHERVNAGNPDVDAAPLGQKSGLAAAAFLIDSMPAAGIDGVHPTDVHRSYPTLGWDAHDTRLFTDVEAVPGTHFEMFSF